MKLGCDIVVIKRKRILLFLAVFIIVFFIVLFLSKSNSRYLKGDIVVWTEERYYSYFVNIAKEFKESNKKVNIKVLKIDKNEYVNKLLTTDKKDLPNVVQLNFVEIERLKNRIDLLEENKNIIETYKKNFSSSRIKEVEDDGKYYGVPFESKPIALYVREDILNKYGYEIEDINIWSQLINIGNDIKNKSSDEINLFSNKDKMNINILMLSQLVDKETYNKDKIINEINNIYKEDYVTEDDNYLFRIASLDFYDEIVKGSIKGRWECKNPPSFSVGENRLYDLGGKNLVALNVEKNKEAIKEFIAYSATNKELLSRELLEYEFFPSSLYSLKVKYEENKENIEGTSPFLTLMNIVERAPSIRNFDVLKEMLLEIYGD